MTTPVTIPRNLCSGHDYIDFFICGICGSLAVNWSIHDGAFGQPYCQRVFCGACIDSHSVDPANIIRGRNGIAKIICPTINCNANFQSPILRTPSIFELTSYRNIIVQCPGCGSSFGAERYSNHRVSCTSEPSCSGSLVRDHESGVLALNPSVDNALRDASIRDKRQLVSSHSLGGRFEKYTYGRMTNTPRGVVLRIFFRNRFFRVQVDPSKDFAEFLDEVRGFFRVSGVADLIHIRHVSLKACNSFKDFIKSIPVGAPINLMPRQACVSDPNYFVSYEVKATSAN
uniref:Uncharacterized protein n=1 Tax=Tetranychus urticae TaxID=32264 RepID=T1JR46_TETUR